MRSSELDGSPRQGEIRRRREVKEEGMTESERNGKRREKEVGGKRLSTYGGDSVTKSRNKYHGEFLSLRQIVVYGETTQPLKYVFGLDPANN